MKKLLFILLFIIVYSNVYAIDLDVIARIESNNNPRAYNKYSKAKGLYQITPVCLAEYNAWHRASKINSNALYSPVASRTVARWYLAIRIPQMLKSYGIKVIDKNILICYNWGIVGCIKYNKGKSRLPLETRNYILKYERKVKNARI